MLFRSAAGTVYSNGNVNSTHHLGGQNNYTNGYYYVAMIGGSYKVSYASYTTCFQYLQKFGGSFSIPHPNPELTNTNFLTHSFVESPTAGDNLYRFKVTTSNCKASLELPSYFKFLNESETMKIAPVNHFGKAYGKIDETQSCVDFISNFDGEYNVLIFGTRKDEAAQYGWRGVEQVRAIHENFIGDNGGF